MKKAIIYCFIALLFSFNTFSFTIHGNIFDSSMNVVSDVTITVNDEVYMSDENGYFNISQVSDNIFLKAVKDGYIDYSKNLIIQKDSQFSFTMNKMTKNTNTISSDIFKITSSHYGISGILNLIDCNILSPEKTILSYSFSRIDFAFKGNEFHRNSSNIRLVSGVEKDIEVGFSFFVTEDSSFNVVTESNVFALKSKIGSFEGLSSAISYVTRGGNDSLILSADYSLDNNIQAILNFVYNINSDKSKADIGIKYVLSPYIQLESELVMGFYNQKAQSVFRIVGSKDDYEVFFFYIDDILNNYQVTGAGFDYKF
ncbi:MAG: carboxypeptidase-like regulatory domain-containing protein [Candidatus Muirbacterium halophilum]|nr:carboxypeptidase-like regulatory domain-containing protein [Candidatus Muirbacterium halophilum]MCK9475382.1 carboxypeptidase-like regulatory domain-containing protein [Candidatus Muirbacterium halophilum]